MGLEVFKADVEHRMGKKLEPARAYTFENNLDNYGWRQGRDGKWHFTMFIENGRVEDNAHHQFKTGLREVASVHKGDFRLTANQHVVLSDVAEEDLNEMKRLLNKWGLDNVDKSALRLSSSACVAFPTCGLAMAESERYLPVLIDKVEKICEEAGVRGDSIVMRMTGCPNGCARPWAAEVAFVGKAPGSYMVS
jgi:sulfite reductase (NADPH) hemoprotein beta-component